MKLHVTLYMYVNHSKIVSDRSKFNSGQPLGFSIYRADLRILAKISSFTTEPMSPIPN